MKDDLSKHHQMGTHERKKHRQYEMLRTKDNRVGKKTEQKCDNTKMNQKNSKSE